MRRLLVVALALVALVSCSGGETPSRSSTVPSAAETAAPIANSPQDVEFVRAVNAACKAYADSDAALDDPRESEDYVPFMESFIANSARLDDEFARLDPPAAFAGFDAYAKRNRDQTDILRAAAPKVAEAVRDDDLARADAVIDQAIDDFNTISDELEPDARRFGFTECAG